MSNLGKWATDKITGFSGVITSKHEYLTGCSQYGIQPPIKQDGSLPDVKYFDEGRIEIQWQQVKPEDVAAKDNGCDYRPNPNN